MPSKSDHELVPVHEIMSDKDVKELFKTFNITIDNLPKIFESDVQAKKLEAKPGQVLKIYRREGKREYPYYRAVIDG